MGYHVTKKYLMSPFIRKDVMVETGKVLYIKFLYSIRTSTRFIDYIKGIK